MGHVCVESIDCEFHTYRAAVLYENSIPWYIVENPQNFTIILTDVQQWKLVTNIKFGGIVALV